MSPFTLLSMSADALHPLAEAPRESMGGSPSERRWGLCACIVTFATLALAITFLPIG